MMPTRPVVIRRWEVVAAFLLLVAASVSVAFWNDYRIDQAEERITRNARTATQALAKAEILAAENRLQDSIRAERVNEFRRQNIALCEQIEAIKDRIRATVRVNETELRDNLREINIDPDSPQGQAIIRRAKEAESDALERFAPEDCGALTKQ